MQFLESKPPRHPSPHVLTTPSHFLRISLSISYLPVPARALFACSLPGAGFASGSCCHLEPLHPRCPQTAPGLLSSLLRGRMQQMGSQMVMGTARHRMCRSIPCRQWTGTNCEGRVRQLPVVLCGGQKLQLVKEFENSKADIWAGC